MINSHLGFRIFPILEEAMATHWKVGKVFIVASIKAKYKTIN
jgi:hypothetical protein